MKTLPATLATLAPALLWALAATPAQATLATSSAAVGGLKGSGAGFAVVCTTPTCNDAVELASLPDSLASVSGSFDDIDSGVSFSAAAQASASAVDYLRARAMLTVSGEASSEHIWFANARTTVDSTMVIDPASPADVGLAAFASLRYRFDGTLGQTSSGPVATSALVSALVLLPDTPGNGSLCLTDLADPGFCTASGLGVVYGTSFAYQVMLQTVVEARVTITSLVMYSADVDLDYSHSLQLVGATLQDNKGGLLTGWQLRAVDEGRVLVSSPVPEPASALLLLAGLAGGAGLARRRR